MRRCSASTAAPASQTAQAGTCQTKRKHTSPKAAPASAVPNRPEKRHPRLVSPSPVNMCVPPQTTDQITAAAGQRLGSTKRPATDAPSPARSAQAADHIRTRVVERRMTG